MQQNVAPMRLTRHEPFPHCIETPGAFRHVVYDCGKIAAYVKLIVEYICHWNVICYLCVIYSGYMDIILTILGYVAIVLQWGALYIGLPIVLLYFVYRGIVKPIVSLVRKSNRSSFPYEHGR